MIPTLSHFLVVAALLFALGLFTVAHPAQRGGGPDGRRADAQRRQRQPRRLQPASWWAALAGQTFALFVIVLAAAEAAVGLAIVLSIFHTFKTIDVRAADLMRE